MIELHRRGNCRSIGAASHHGTRRQPRIARMTRIRINRRVNYSVAGFARIQAVSADLNGVKFLSPGQRPGSASNLRFLHPNGVTPAGATRWSASYLRYPHPNGVTPHGAMNHTNAPSTPGWFFDPALHTASSPARQFAICNLQSTFGPSPPPDMASSIGDIRAIRGSRPHFSFFILHLPFNILH